MTVSRDHQRAAACFAVARSATIAGERDAAIARGTAICQRAGLSLDAFDVPGRTVRPRPRTTPPAPDRWSRDELRHVMARHRAHMADADLRPATASALDDLAAALDRAAERAGARDDETPYDARVRNFHAACAAARARDAAA